MPLQVLCVNPAAPGGGIPALVKALSLRLYAFLNSHKLRRDPGDEFEYSNVGVALLGHVIALKAGQDYETLVRERICRPLKMDSTVITMTPQLEARRATGHARTNRKAGYIGLQQIPGSGALFSTANDMLKFASARLGMTSIRELRGRSDVLCYLSEEPAAEVA